MEHSIDDKVKYETGEITRGVIINVLGLSMERSELSEETNLFDLGMDSLSVVRLVVALEEELGIQIPAYDLSAELFHRLGSLVEFLLGLRTVESKA